MTSWPETKQNLGAAGFSDADILAYERDQRAELQNAGFSQKDIDEHFGVKTPDLSGMKTYFEENLKQRAPTEGAEEADDFLGALDAGWQMSVSGLIKRGAGPNVVLPEHAPMYLKIASEVSTLAGDLPAMVAGAFGGGVAGGAAGAAAGTVALPVVGTVGLGTAGALVGAGAGSNALPTAIREILMDHYEKGEIHDFGDFWERSSAILLNTIKSGAVGGVTAGAGGAVGRVTARVAAPALASSTARVSSEIATMVTAGKALEGEIPKAEDFVSAAALVGGMHVSISAAGRIPKTLETTTKKMREVYAKTGVKPTELLDLVERDATVLQDVLSDNISVPKTLEPMVETVQKPAPNLDAPVRSAATEKILSQIGDQVEAAPKTKISFSEFYRNFVDKFDPIKRATEDLSGQSITNIDTVNNPYHLARMANDYKSKARHAIERGTLDFETLETNGKSLREIYSPFKDDISGFEAYLVSKRSLEVEARGKQSGFDIEAAREVVQEGRAKYEAASQEVVEYNNRNLKYLKDSGFLTNEKFESFIEAGKSYIPFSRILDPADARPGGGLGSLKEFKGSDLKIQKPLLSMLENTETIARLAERNRALRSLVDLAESVPDQSVISKIEASKNPHSEFVVYRDGKRELFTAEQPLVEAIQALDGNAPATNLAFKIARGITTAKKIGISLTPDFILRNVFRDQITAGTLSKHGSLPFVDIVGAMGDVIKKSDVYYDWVKSGGGNGSFLELNQKYLENDVFDLSRQTGLIEKTWNTLARPVDFLQAAGSLAENATRLAEYKRVSGGESSGPNVFRGGFAAREITVDFQRMGARMSAFNAITAFQNVSIQGLDRTLRAIKDDPTGVSTRAALYITTPSVLLWWANHDDARYAELPRWQKDLFWIIPTDRWESASPADAKDLPSYLVREGGETGIEINTGTIYRVPKPQELGILFGSIPERLLEQFFTDNPKALKDFGSTVADLISPGIVPDAIAAPMEHYFNKSMFTERPIIPFHLERIAPEYRYMEYTTEAGKALGKLIGHVPGARDFASPIMVEHYVRSWAGTSGMYALQLADKLLTPAEPDVQKPETTLADVPFVKAFVVRFPSAGAQSIQDFNDRYREFQEKKNTISHLAKQGNYEAWRREAEMQETNLADPLNEVKKALSQQHAFIMKIQRDKTLPPGDKRQLIDGAYYHMIETAKRGNKMIQDYEKTNGGR